MRSSRPDVRNPLKVLPSFQRIRSLPPESRQALRALMVEMSQDAGARAEKCWRKSKPPMAAYWKAVAVYAKHVARLLK